MRRRLSVRFLSLCQVDSIVLSIGPPAGVESELLNRAYEVARAETVAKNAELEIEMRRMLSDNQIDTLVMKANP